jgi:hypothetical protein
MGEPHHIDFSVCSNSLATDEENGAWPTLADEAILLECGLEGKAASPLDRLAAVCGGPIYSPQRSATRVSCQLLGLERCT